MFVQVIGSLSLCILVLCFEQSQTFEDSYSSDFDIFLREYTIHPDKRRAIPNYSEVAIIDARVGSSLEDNLIIDYGFEHYDSYYYPSVVESHGEQVYNNQDVWQKLLTEKIKLDVPCLSEMKVRTGKMVQHQHYLYRLFFLTCALHRARDGNRSLLVLTGAAASQSSHSEFLIPDKQIQGVLDQSLLILQREGIDMTDLSLHQSIVSPSDHEHIFSNQDTLTLSSWLNMHGQNFTAHQEKDCKLWWPLNHTDLAAHTMRFDVTEHAWQTFVFECSLPSEFTLNQIDNSPDTSYMIHATLQDYYDLTCGEDCAHSFHSELNIRDIIFRDFVSPDNKLTLAPVSGGFQLRYRNYQRSHEDQRVLKKTEYIITLRESNRIDQTTKDTELGRFVIYQNIVPYHRLNIGLDKASSQSQDQRYGLNLSQEEIFRRLSLLSTTTSREDLGYMLSSIFKPQGHFSFVEIGVLKGEFAQRILQTSSIMSFYCGIDVWRPVSEKQSSQMQEDNYQAAIRSITDLPPSISDRADPILPIKLLIREDANRAVHLFSNNSIDVVYIDALHDYSSAVKDIVAWYPKVKVGGIISGHDYRLGTLDHVIFGVKAAVDKLVRDNHFVLFLTSSDEHPSWMILKTA